MKMYRLVLPIIISMFFAVPAYATEAIAPVVVESVKVEASAEDSFEFVFRNGVVWGTTPENVEASETGNAHRDSDEEYELLSYGEVPVSNYSAELSYIFHKGILVSTYYYFDVLPSEDYEYLVAALTSKYGMPITPEAFRQTTLMNIISPPAPDVYMLTNWELPDGTYVALFSMDENMEDQFALMYSNEDALLLIGGIYNTAGL